MRMALSPPQLDPVCGMTVRAEPPPERRAEYEGTTYWFCGAGCQRKFVADPAKYLGAAPKPAHGAPAHHELHASPAPMEREALPSSSAIYTCPMHPEVRQRGPGACPLCGMALEPADVTTDEAPNP